MSGLFSKAASSGGFWKPHTSLIDFCEVNYAQSPWVAEFHNAWSSLVLSLICVVFCVRIVRMPAALRTEQRAAVLLQEYKDTENPLRVHYEFYRKFMTSTCTWGFLFFVGFGSCFLHVTLQRWAQAIDELPMIYGNSLLIYLLEWPTVTQWRKYMLSSESSSGCADKKAEDVDEVKSKKSQPTSTSSRRNETPVRLRKPKSSTTTGRVSASPRSRSRSRARDSTASTKKQTAEDESASGVSDGVATSTSKANKYKKGAATTMSWCNLNVKEAFLLIVLIGVTVVATLAYAVYEFYEVFFSLYALGVVYIFARGLLSIPAEITRVEAASGETRTQLVAFLNPEIDSATTNKEETSKESHEEDADSRTTKEQTATSATTTSLTSSTMEVNNSSPTSASKNKMKISTSTSLRPAYYALIGHACALYGYGFWMWGLEFAWCPELLQTSFYRTVPYYHPVWHFSAGLATAFINLALIVQYCARLQIPCVVSWPSYKRLPLVAIDLDWVRTSAPRVELEAVSGK